MRITLLGIVIEVKFLQFENALLFIHNSVSGNTISESKLSENPDTSVTVLPLCSLGITILPSKS